MVFIIPKRKNINKKKHQLFALIERVIKIQINKEQKNVVIN